MNLRVYYFYTGDTKRFKIMVTDVAAVLAEQILSGDESIEEGWKTIESHIGIQETRIPQERQDDALPSTGGQDDRSRHS